MGIGIPDYKNLDLSGEAGQAALNMEDRAREPASQEMFQRLIAPILQGKNSVLEFGCGSGALSARIARHNPQAQVLATDKSQGMLDAAQILHQEPNLRFQLWDVTNSEPPQQNPDLIISSVVVPYLTPEDTEKAVQKLKGMLKPGGALAFLEQDIHSLQITSGAPEFTIKYLGKITALIQGNPYRGRGLAPLLERQGFQPLEIQTFTWTDPNYCPYVRRLLARTAADMAKAGDATEEEGQAWLESMETLAAQGTFMYCLNYNLIAGTL